MIAGVHYATILPLASIPVLAAAVLGLAAGRSWGGRALRLALAMILAGWLVYMYAFITLDFRLAEAARTESTGLTLWYRIAASWSSGGSSLYLFSTMLAAAGLYAVGRSSGRWLHAGLGLIVLIGMVSALLNGAFDVYPPGVGGLGLNPLLKNPWVLPHPLSTFTGYALLAVAGFALLVGERGWPLPLLMLGWVLLSLGLAFGGYWSYDTFGWGGYWGWDPVEISQLSVWLAATATIHSVGVLSAFRRLTAALTAGAVFTALYVTRSGLSPLHSFAAANIGSAILLATGLALVAAGVIAFAQRGDWQEAYKRISKAFSGRVYEAAFAVGGLSLLLMALFVYSSLLAPSLLTVLGYSASVPTMAEGVRFYHPVLYPLMMIVTLTAPGVVLARRLGEEGYNSFLAVAVTLAVVATLSVYRGVLEPSPMSSKATNVMIAAGMAAASIAAGVLLAGVVADIRDAVWRGRAGPGLRRGLLLSLVHLGMILAFLGVLVSGAYAFSDRYMMEYTLRPGEEVGIGGGITIGLVDYNYTPGSGSVDLYHHKDKIWATTFMAWNGLNALSRDLAPTVRSVALAAANGNGTVQALRGMLLDSPYNARNVTLEAPAIVYEGGDSTEPVGRGHVRIMLRDASVIVDLEPVVEAEGGLKGGLVKILVNASHTSIYLNGTRLDAGGPYLITFDNPQNITVGDLTVTMDTVVVNGTRGGGILEVAGGGVSLDGAYIKAHSTVPRNVYLYLEAERGRAGLLARILDSGTRWILENKTLLDGIVNAGPQGLPLPEDALENVMLKLRLNLTRPDGSVEPLESVLRFEVNGEAMGIHGLIIDVIVLDDGLNDIYINVQPSFVDGYFDSYHELLVYYLNQAQKNLSPQEALALAAVMAAGYNIAASSQPPEQQGLTVEKALVDLLLLSESFNPSNSTINTNGITLRVKIVPGIELLWLGAAVMIAAALASLLAFHLKRT